MSELRAGQAVTVSGVTIIPIEKVCAGTHRLLRRIWACGFKEPIALVLCEATGARAVDCLGGELVLGDLMRKVPGLESAIAQHSGHYWAARIPEPPLNYPT